MSQPNGPEAVAGEARRALLKKAGRLAVVTAPAVALLLAVKSKPAVAQVISLDK